MRILLACILSLGTLPGGAQLLHHQRPIPYATVTTYSRQQPDAFSFLANPAALANIKNPVAGFLGEKPFLLPELFAASIGAAIPAGNSRFGLTLRHTGTGQQRQTGTGLSFAQVLGDRGSLGAGFYYQSLATAGYGAVQMVAVSLGGALQLTEQLQGGFRVWQPATGRGSGGERMAAQYSLGLGTDLSEQFFLSAVLDKQEGLPPEVQAAFSYNLSKKLRGRLGVHTGTGLFFAGGGFAAGLFQVDVFSCLHPRLGLSPGLMITYNPARQP